MQHVAGEGILLSFSFSAWLPLLSFKLPVSQHQRFSLTTHNLSFLASLCVWKQLCSGAKRTSKKGWRQREAPLKLLRETTRKHSLITITHRTTQLFWLFWLSVSVGGGRSGLTARRTWAPRSGGTEGKCRVCMLSPCLQVGFLQVLQLPPPVQNQARLLLSSCWSAECGRVWWWTGWICCLSAYVYWNRLDQTLKHTSQVKSMN